MAKASEREKTIKDFGDQWTTFTRNDGYYASVELLADIIAPFLTVADLQNLNCAEIGAGTGRISAMMLEAHAGHVTAIEPSDAYYVLLRNVARYGARVTCVHAAGEDIPNRNFDLVVSIGVLHHIPDPKPVVDAAIRSLCAGGRIIIWLYGNEGSSLYRTIFIPVRGMTKRMPLAWNSVIARILYPFVLLYAKCCKKVPSLPLSTYLCNVWQRFDPATRKLVIIDQINPHTARYYTRDEAEELLRSSGFDQVASYHRHGYSWTVTGINPANSSETTV